MYGPYYREVTKNMQFLFVSYMFLLGCQETSSQSYDNVTELLSTLLTGYNKDVRPITDQSASLPVTVSMELYSILEVDIMQGAARTVLGMPCTWQDQRIRWNPADYDGITTVKIQQQYVWTPLLFQLLQKLEFRTAGYEWLPVIYNSSGHATWRPGGVHIATCPMNLRYWPYDEQECNLSYGVYGNLNNDVLLESGIFDTDFYTENGEWALNSNSVNSDRLAIAFTFKIKRYATFYTESLIIPMIVLSFLSSFVFLLPSEAGERVSYCITLLLSNTVLLDSVSDEVPKLSKPVPMICNHLLLIISMSALATIAMIINLALYHRSPTEPVGKYYRVIVQLTTYRNHKVHTEQSQEESNKTTEITVVDLPEKINSPHKVLAEKTESQMYTERMDCRTNIDISWQQVSVAIDKILFVLFTMCTICSIMTMMLTFSLHL